MKKSIMALGMWLVMTSSVMADNLYCWDVVEDSGEIHRYCGSLKAEIVYLLENAKSKSDIDEVINLIKDEMGEN